MIPAGGHFSAEVFGPCPVQAIQTYPSSAFTQVCLCSRVSPITPSVGTYADMAAWCLSCIPSRAAGVSITATKPEILVLILIT